MRARTCRRCSVEQKAGSTRSSSCQVPPALQGVVRTFFRWFSLPTRRKAALAVECNVQATGRSIDYEVAVVLHCAGRKGGRERSRLTKRKARREKPDGPSSSLL